MLPFLLPGVAVEMDVCDCDIFLATEDRKTELNLIYY